MSSILSLSPWRRPSVVAQIFRCLSPINLKLANFSTEATPPVPSKDENSISSSIGTTGSISKAMKSYLERAAQHNKFMEEAEEEFKFGKRHLANMMGKDPENFTQSDIDESIRYLFPSGLFQTKARPMMKPPLEIHPKQKAAQFDSNGRPHHPLFYTARPNFYHSIHEAMEKIKSLKSAYIESSSSSSSASLTQVDGTTWVSKEELEERFLEKLSDELYEEWKNCMDRLISHPLSSSHSAYISSFRKPLSNDAIIKKFPPVVLEADGRQSVTVEGCRKKSCRGRVKVSMPGSGKMSINGIGIEYFSRIRNREAILYPLQLSDWLGTVDIEAQVDGGGSSAQAAVIRFGLANALASLGADSERLRLAGLLTIDKRHKERNHRGCEGARAKWPWKAR